MCAFFRALRCDKTTQDKNQYFSVSVLCPSSSKQKLTVPLEKHTVFELLHLQNSFLNFFEKLSKMPKDKKLKTKARYENSKIDTFMFPQFKHISHLAKKIELLILVKNWEPRGRRRYTISTGLC